MIEAESEITLFYVSEIDCTIRYYLLQATSANPPGKPTTYPPGGNWQTTEPEYIASSMNSLYFTDLTVLTNGDFSYSEVSKSSSYEASRDAWNKANSITDDVTALKEWQVEASSLITKDGIINTVGNYYATTTLVDGVTTRVTEAETKITQNADNINLRVEKSGVISAINQSSEAVSIAASKINLSGYVTISGLGTAGQTTVNGSNITTGTISADRIDVNGIFAQDITATGTITGAVLKGASGQFTGTVDAQTLYVKDKIQIYASSYSSAVTILEETKEDDINNLILGSYSYGSIISRNQISAPSIYVSGIATIPTLNITDRIEISQATPYIDFHWGNTDTDYTSRIIENNRNELDINGARFTLGGAIWGKSLSIDGNVYVNGSGSFGTGVACANESRFYVNSYIDPMPGVTCAIKASGIIAASALYAAGSGSGVEAQVHAKNDSRDVYLCASGSGRAGIYDTKHGWIIFNENDCKTTYIQECKIYNGKVIAKADSTSWLVGASPGGASFESINITDGALVPIWRCRTADGAWVGASYAYDPGFRIYYANNARLNKQSDNGTDARFTFGASGVFYATSIKETSDEQRKNIRSGITEEYEKLFMTMEPILFDWKNNPDGIHMGFGAQSVFHQAEVCGIKDFAAVHQGVGDEPWSIAYSEFVPLLVQMTQKALTSIDSTRKEVSTLESSMTARMESLQYQLAQAFDRIVALEKENKSLRQALS